MPVVVGFKRGDFEYAEIMFSPSGKAVRRCVNGELPDVRVQSRDGELVDMRQVEEYWRTDPRLDRPTITPVEVLWEKLKARTAATSHRPE
jgi:hypothetical protein